jgi:hypothetical protein
MWFYMKYIVKNHSDRILLARLCTIDYDIDYYSYYLLIHDLSQDL